MDLERLTTSVLRYVGSDAVDLTRPRERLRAVGALARRKAGGRDPQFNERVGFKVLSEAAYTDDEVVSEYLAGVLASSGPDRDYGASVVALIGRLSSLHLRLHYVIYRELRRLWPEYGIPNLYQQKEARAAGIKLTGSDLLSVGGDQVFSSAASVVWTLTAEGLLQDQWDFKGDADAPGGIPMSLEVRPSAIGAELFLWGNGAEGTDAHSLFDPTTRLRFEVPIPGTPNASLLTPPAPPDSTAEALGGAP